MDKLGTDEANKFLKSIRDYKGMWSALDLKMVVKKNEGSYELLGMSAVLQEEALSGSDIFIDLSELQILHQTIELNDRKLTDFINNLIDDKIILENMIISVNNFSRYASATSYQHSATALAQKPEWPYIYLESVGNKPIREFIDENNINNQLIDSGYENLEDACKDLIGLEIGGGRYPIISIIALIYIMPSIQIEDNTLKLDLISHDSISCEDLTISYAAKASNEKKNGKFTFSKNDISQRDGVLVHFGKKEGIPLGTNSIKFWIIYKKNPIYTKAIYDIVGISSEIDSKWTAFNLLFTHIESGTIKTADEIFNKNLGLNAGRAEHGDRFELAILNLMSLAGFEVLFLGKGINSSGVDIIGFHPGEHKVLAISCTISNNIGDKIQTLLIQTNKLRAHFNDYEIIPVIISAISLKDIRITHIDDARNHQMSLVLTPEIKRIYEEIQKNNGKEIRDFVIKIMREKIPMNKNSGNIS